MRTALTVLAPLLLLGCAASDRPIAASTAGTTPAAPYAPPPPAMPAPSVPTAAPAPLPLTAPVMPAQPAAPAASGRAFPRNEPSFASLQAEARRTGRPILILLYADWCGYCQKLMSDTLPHPRVVRATQRYISARYNADRGEGKRLSDRFGVRGFPNIIMVNAEGRVLDQWGGYNEPDIYAAIIEQMKTR